MKKKTKGNGKKLCFMKDIDKDKMAFHSYKKIVQDPQYVCRGCGRVAKDSQSLCTPETLN